MKMSGNGLVIVISAPSGAGKSTLCSKLAQKLPNLYCSVSCTTRPKRPGEKDGRDYFFVSEKKFKEMIRRKELVEWACVHDHYYGIPRQFLEKNIRAGKDTVLNIDVQGALKIRRLFPGSVLIFVMTPTMAELEKRLRARKQDSDAVIRTRLRNARRELRFLPKYDYLVINDKLADALCELEAIVIAEHRRLAHLSPPRFK